VCAHVCEYILIKHIPTGQIITNFKQGKGKQDRGRQKKRLSSKGSTSIRVCKIVETVIIFTIYF
jgi:hypothetical protein